MKSTFVLVLQLQMSKRLHELTLLLENCTASVLQQGIRNTVNEYLQSFSKYDWLWKDDKDLAYNLFMKKDPRYTLIIYIFT
jgi:hypothetical protein